jgi:hypothetical protein
LASSTASSSEERPEREAPNAPGREYLDERCGERCSGRRRARSGDQREGRPTGLGCPNEVVAEREREVVEPLHVVDDDHRRFDASERTVRGLEDPHRLECGGLLRREDERLEPFAR